MSIQDSDTIHKDGLLRRAISMYVDGFKSMTVGRSLWVLIIVKVIVLFAVFKLFFFPNVLEREYSNDNDRAEAVRGNLTRGIE